MPLSREDHAFRSVFCTACGHQHTFPLYCGDRFCDVCTGARRARVRRVLDHLMRSARPRPGERLVQIVLTLRSTTDLEAQVKHLVASFRRLRQRRVWRNKVSGGAFVIEVTGGPDGWHAHLHVIASAVWFPHRQLSNLWLKVSGSYIVWVGRVTPKRGTYYLTKYISKASVSPHVQDEVAYRLQAARLFQPFGSWHGKAGGVQHPSMVCPDCGGDSWIVPPHRLDDADDVPAEAARASPNPLLQTSGQHDFGLDAGRSYYGW